MSMKRIRHHAPLMESLPPRLLLAASLEDGVLAIWGTDQPDMIDLAIGATNRVEVRYAGSSTPTESFDRDDVQRVRVLGLGGDDSLFASAGPDLPVTLSGGAGDDEITSRSEGPLLKGGAGADLLDSAGGLENLFGGAGRDTLLGLSGRDIVVGKLRAEFRNKTLLIHGTRGNDTVGWSSLVSAHPGVGTVFRLGIDLNGYTRYDVPRFNRVMARMGAGNDSIRIPDISAYNGWDEQISATILGGAGDDSISGGVLDDSIFGGAGDDSLVGGGGRDDIRGGSGQDHIEDSRGDGLILDPDNGLVSPMER